MTLFFISLIVAFSFFTQSLLGFGGGLICIPILSLFMPVQDAVSMVMIYQFSMGLLIVKTYKDTQWSHIFKMLPATIIGAICGVLLLNILHGDIIRALLAAYIILHLARKHTSFDPLGKVIRWGDAHLAGALGGTLNAMIGGGGPAFILYLKEKIPSATQFRATIIAMLMISNIPRSIGTISTGLLTTDLFITGMYAFPGFLLALYLGQKLHGKIPQAKFFIAVECLLAISASLLLVKIIT
ncbi:MAG: sulfite exporter TauE/SafE family protein [Alphaproteobacteria bacterium]